jgi:hypothetical protein
VPFSISDWRLIIIQEPLDRKIALTKISIQIVAPGGTDWGDRIREADMICPNDGNGCQFDPNCYPLESPTGGDAVFQSGVDGHKT